MSASSGGSTRISWICAAVIPAIALVVVPSFSSPFLAAKTTVLLIGGALAAFSFVRPADFEIIPARSLGWAAAFCTLALFVSTLHARNWAECWHALAPIMAAALFFMILLRYRVSAGAILVAIALSAAAVALLAIAGHFGYDLPRFIGGTPAPGRMRTAATLGNPLFVSSFLACGFWTAVPFPMRFWRVITSSIILAGILITTERTGIFALALGMIIYAVIIYANAGRGHQRVVILACALVLIVFSFAHGNPRSLKTTMQGRMFLWKTSLHHITLFGSGPGSFYRIYNQSLRETSATIPANEFHFVNYETDSYNIYVQAVVEEGLLGFAVLLVFFAAWFHMAWRARKTNSGLCSIGAVATFLAAGLSDDPLSRPEGMVLLAAWLAVPVLVLLRDNPAVFKLESSHSGLRSTSFVIASTISLLLLIAGTITAFSNYAVHAGEIAEDRGDWALAERWDRAVLRFDPAQRDAHYDLVRVLAQEGQYQASLAESDRALIWVNEAELNLIRIRVLPMVGKREQAQDELIRTQKEFPWSEELQQEVVPGSH